MRIWKSIVGQEGVLSKQLEIVKSLQKFEDDPQRQMYRVKSPCCNDVSRTIFWSIVL
jgi:hypothetical protein